MQLGRVKWRNSKILEMLDRCQARLVLTGVDPTGTLAFSSYGLTFRQDQHNGFIKPTFLVPILGHMRRLLFVVSFAVVL